MENEINNSIPQAEEEQPVIEQHDLNEETASAEAVETPSDVEALPENDSGETEDTEESGADGEETPEDNELLPEEEERACPNCGSQAVFSGHEYCRKCEKKLVKVKVPFFSYIAGAAAVLFSLFAFIIMLLSFLPSLQVFEGVIYEQDNLIYPALDSYQGTEDVISKMQEYVGALPALGNMVSKGSNLDNRIFKVTVKFYNPLRAQQYVQYIFTSPGASKFKEKSKAVQENQKIYSAYENMYIKIADAYNSIAEAEKVTPEDGKASILTIESYRGKEGIDDVLVDLFEYDVAGMSGMGNDVEIKYLKMAHEDQKKSDFDWRFLYIKPFADMLMRQGEVDEAVTMLKEIAEEDKSAFDPYMQLAKAYQIQGKTDELKDLIYEYCANNVTSEGQQSDSAYCLLLYLYRVTGEYDEMEETAESAQALYELIPEFNRQLALAYLSQGRYDEAYEQAYTADEKAYYRSQYYGDSTAMTEEMFATLYVSAFLSEKYGKHDTENADKIGDVISSFEGRTFSGDKVERVLSGEADVKDVLAEGGCDFI